MQLHYVGSPMRSISDQAAKVSREFETALAAFRCGDANPMRLYLGLPLKGDCEDCGITDHLFPHGKSLVCIDCYKERQTFLEEVIK